jgi:hypothetical protein
MNDQAGRLVDHQKVLVFIQDMQRDGFGDGLYWGGGGHLDSYLLRGPQAIGCLCRGPVDPDRALLDKPLNLMA